jgi:hypothetical protein
MDATAMQSMDLAIFPRSGRCSVSQCTASTTSAIRRGASGTRQGHWQLYCSAHAHERGVDTRGEQLDWVEGYPLIGGGPTWRR